MESPVCQRGNFEGDALWNTQPVQTEELVCYVIRTVKSEDESCRSILNRLQAAQHAGWQTHQNAEHILYKDYVQGT
jgi:hypothetical protein